MIAERRVFLLALACAVLGVTAHAQPLEFVQKTDLFTVQRDDGTQYINPFSGGLVQPRIGLVDADGDGLPDLFTLNPDNRLRLYRNEGNLQFRRMLLSPYGQAPVRSWFRLADIDADGDLDLFTAGALSEVLLYHNGGTSINPSFPAQPDTLRHGDTRIFTQQETVPSLVDIDADGDLDLFSGNIDGSITFYRNSGTATAPAFTFVTAHFGDILVVSGGMPRRKDTPSGIGRVLTRHGASVLDFADLDRDGDLDILFGDFFTDKLLLFKNTGTRENPSFGMDRLDTAFRPGGDVVSSTGFNQPVTGDIDADGDLDVLVSSLYPLAPDQPVTFYENTSGTAPGMAIMRRRPLDITSEIDAGSFSAPAFISDSEREGILIGSSDGSLTLFSHRWNQPESGWEYAGQFATLPNLFQAVPTAADLDGDGKAEILVGDANDGRVRLFRFQNGQLQNSPWQLDTFKVNQYAAPSLVDLDRNGTFDLFIGAGNGRFVYFENTGTPTAPVFRPATPPAPFNTLDIGQNSTIAFADFNGDGAPDAMVGGREGPDRNTGFVKFYLNTAGQFIPAEGADIITDRNPVPMAIPAQGGMGLIIGQQAGGLLGFGRTPSSAVPMPEAETSTISITPTVLAAGNRMILVRGNIQKGPSSLVMFDLLGRGVFQTELRETAGSTALTLPDLPSGTYQILVSGRPAGRVVILE